MIEGLGGMGACVSRVSALLAETRFDSQRTFGRRTCLGGKPFGCRSMPPKMDFHLWRALRATEGAAEPTCLSALEVLSAAEPAAESALFSLPLHVLHDCFEVF